MIIPSYPTQPQWFNQFSRNRSPAAAPRAILLKSPASDQQIINFDTFYGEEPPAATAAASGVLIDRTGVWVSSHQYSGHQPANRATRRTTILSNNYMGPRALFRYIQGLLYPRSIWQVYKVHKFHLSSTFPGCECGWRESAVLSDVYLTCHGWTRDTWHVPVPT